MTLQDERSFKQEPKKCAQLLNSFSRTLKKLTLIGFYSLATYVEVTRELKYLKEFSLKTHKLPNGCLNLKSNSSIETLSIDGLGRGRMLCPLMDKFPNVKNLKFFINDRECWRMIASSMTKLENFESSTISASNIIDLEFPKVKRLYFSNDTGLKHVSYEFGWRLLKKSFPNIESLTLIKCVSECDILKIICENWKGLKYLRIEEFEKSYCPTLKTFKLFFRNCSKLKRIVIPKANLNGEALKALTEYKDLGLQFI